MRLSAVLILLGVLAAGCATPSDAPAATEDGTAPVGTGDSPGGAAAAAPASTDVGHMPHMHDYWLGRERVQLFDGEIDPSKDTDPFMPFYGIPNGQIGATNWRLPDGAIVMEGTGTMELTATFDDPLVTSVGVSFRIGENGEWSDTLALPNGKTVTIAVTPAMSDLPHMTTSRWQYVFLPGEAPGTLMAPFQLRVELVKLDDIMLFPGHAELFEGLPEKILHDQVHEHAEESYAKRAPQIVTAGGFQEKFVAPSKLVPMETLAMRVEVEILEATATPGVVADIRFFYRGANTSYLGHPTTLPLEGSLEEGRLVYQFAVAPEETDTPYGESSQWLFFVEPSTKVTGEDEEPDCGGCADVQIRYHLTVTAYDHPLDAYSKREGDA